MLKILCLIDDVTNWVSDKNDSKEHDALARSVISQFEQYIKLNKKIPPEVLVSLNQIEEPSKLADTVASHLALKIAEKQELLELSTVAERLEKAYALMEAERCFAGRKTHKKPCQKKDGENSTRVLFE